LARVTSDYAVLATVMVDTTLETDC